MAKVREWLQLWRSHTSPLEVSFAVTGAVLATGTALDSKVLLFALFGWLYHNAGYGQNSIEDYVQGYDREDPNKATHPLQRGVITVTQARAGTYTLMGITALYAVLISRLEPLALVMLLVLVAMGLVYNLVGKRMRTKFLPIALAHSLILPFAYVGAGGTLSWPRACGDRESWAPVLAFSALLFQITYQIMVEGDIKDMGRKEATALDRLGVRLNGERLEVSAAAGFLSALLKVANLVGVLALAGVMAGPAHALITALLFAPAIAYLDRRLVRPGPFDHGGRLRVMALMEVLSTFAILFAVSPAISPLPWGYIGSAAIMAASILYFMGMNRYLWGTVLRPRV